MGEFEGPIAWLVDSTMQLQLLTMLLYLSYFTDPLKWPVETAEHTNGFTIQGSWRWDPLEFIRPVHH